MKAQVIDVEKELIIELRKQYPEYNKHSDEFIINFVGFYSIAYELICNKGCTISEAVKLAPKYFV